MAFHDLTTTLKPPPNLRSLLGLSLKFIPNPKFNVSWENYEKYTIQRFQQDFKIKAYLGGRSADDPANDPSDKGYNPRMYIRTNWNPPEHLFPFPKELPRRISRFVDCLKQTVQPRACFSNLLPHQGRALRSLRNQDDFLVIQCDKNLGPAIIEKDSYIKMAIRDHLSDGTTYKRLTDADCDLYAYRMRKFIEQWLLKWKRELTRNEKRFLRHHLDHNVNPFAAFYITAKVHKTPLKSRPIVSCSGSLLQALGVWVDDKLQHAARAQRSFFKSSFDLRKELEDIVVPENGYLFTADAVSMYTNIPTHRALLFIGRYLRKEKFPDIPTTALMEALSFLMQHNVFTFGDTTWLQKTGTAMGTPPAPPWATLYYALCEEGFLDEFSPLFYYKRFIDDVIGIWTTDHPNDPRDTEWTRFASAMNNPMYQLTWDVSRLSHQVDFMDLTISIKNRHLHTTLFEKPSNLHLYIPPHSCHPPGLLSGMIFGMIYRIYSLCSDHKDIRQRIQRFFRALRRRGYQSQTIRPFFTAAIRHATCRLDAGNPAISTQNDPRHSMFFHLRYHPKNPPSSEIQRLWKNCIQAPPYSKKLENIKNWNDRPLGIDRLIIAYNRPQNLGNLLSYRKLKPTGPPVSSFLE